MNWPLLTTCGLPVRMSWIQSQSEVFRPRSESLTASLVGTIVLKAELSVTGMEEQMCFFKSLSKTFMTVDVRATGR